jgi:dihydrofolate synthase/folylpolyglutamate synthase
MSGPAPRERLHQLGPETVRPGLDRIRALLEQLGNPQLSYPTAIVAGTNGKGSTVAMIAAIARAAGLRVGAYTSPHLVHLEERFSIDGHPISRTGLEAHLDAVLTAAQVMVDSGLLHEHPSYFETLTAVAFRYFAEARADLVVLEVGLGGRLDATNVTAPRVAVITPIALDHTDWLGHDLATIAAEKFAVVPPGGVAVVAPQLPVVMRAIQDLARERGVTVIDSSQYPLNARDDGRTVDLIGRLRNYGGLEIALPGRHQLNNARCASLAAEALDRRRLRIGSDAVWAGLRRVTLPGRCEWVDGHPRALLDGAHNPAAAGELGCHLDDLKELGRYRQLHLVLGVMRDKDQAGITRELFPRATTVTTTRAATARSADPRALVALEPIEGQSRAAVEDPEAALAHAYDMAGDDDLICVTGSLYLLGHLRPLLRPGS